MERQTEISEKKITGCEGIRNRGRDKNEMNLRLEWRAEGGFEKDLGRNIMYGGVRENLVKDFGGGD